MTISPVSGVVSFISRLIRVELSSCPFIKDNYLIRVIRVVVIISELNYCNMVKVMCNHLIFQRSSHVADFIKRVSICSC